MQRVVENDRALTLSNGEKDIYPHKKLFTSETDMRGGTPKGSEGESEQEHGMQLPIDSPSSSPVSCM